MIKYGRKLLSSILAASMVLGSASATIGATAVQVFADEAPAPIVSIAGETLGATTVIEEGYAYTDWQSKVTTGPLYMYTIPAGTTAVDIDFTDNVLAYNYGSVKSSDDDYICGWFADFMTGASTGTFDVDHDNNGAPDYIQVQTPYDADWNTSILYGIGFEYAEEPEVSNTCAMEISSIMRDTGKPSGMYTFENAIVTAQEDGTYLVRMHQANANRNVIALTDDKDAAKDHAVAWYIGGGADGYWFTIPVASLEEPIYAVMSSESRIAAGNDFSNVIVITFDAESMTDTEEAPAVAEDMNISPAVPPVPVEIVTPYTVTANNTGMFKVVDAYMKEVDGTKTLYITLNGTGYHSLYKGTYEEAVATANDMDLWINGVIREDETEFKGKYEFAIPVEDGDSYMQINARSFSKGTWYPRYILIDLTAATIESGDYAAEFALAVTNQNDAAVASAKMNVTAGPNSNNYLVTATVEIPGFVQAYVGNAADAAAATEGCIDAVDGAFTIQAEKLITPGSPAVDTILDQPTAVSFKDEAGNWAEYTLTISKVHRTLTADYQKPVTAIVAQPVDCTVKMGATASFKVEAEGADLAYQWYYSKDGVKWVKSTLAKATTSELSFKVSSVNANNQYKCVVTGTYGDPVTSDIVKAVVLKSAVITKDPEQVVAAKGDAISFKVEAENAVSYQWYYSKDGVKWSKSTLSTAASAEIAIKVSDSNAMNVYRCKVTGEDGSAVISESAGITLKQPAVIVAQPVDSTAKMGKSATFKVEAENAVSYQWYYSKDGVKWVKSTLSSATSATLKFTVSDKNIDNKYRCKVTGEDGKSINTVVVGIAK